MNIKYSTHSISGISVLMIIFFWCNTGIAKWWFGVTLIFNISFWGQIGELLKDNQGITQKKIVVLLGFPQESMGHIIDGLHYQICAKWVSCTLTVQMKLSNVKICQQLLLHYENNGGQFFPQQSWQVIKFDLIIINDKWIIHPINIITNLHLWGEKNQNTGFIRKTLCLGCRCKAS